MSFGLNRVELIGRLGADVTVNHLTSGGRVANLSVATDESYINAKTGERVDKTEWHRNTLYRENTFICRQLSGDSSFRKQNASRLIQESARFCMVL